jgi:hypothetical protein
MADRQAQQLMDQRAQALAAVLLLRRDDLRVQEVVNGPGLDLLVHLRPAERGSDRRFGVALRARLEAATRDTADRFLHAAVRRTAAVGPFSYPVCLFLFTMHETQGWYTWVAEPVVSPDGRAALPHRRKARCEPLTDAAVDEIVSRVNHWWDALLLGLAAEPAGAER